MTTRYSAIRAGVYTAGRAGATRELRVPERLEFTVAIADIAYLNGLRRCILSDVKTAGFSFDPQDPDGQDVRVTRNTTALHNEIIGSRVGLVSIHLPRELLAAFEPADWRFELDVRNEGPGVRDVTTADIRVFRVGGGGRAWGDEDSEGELTLPGGALGTPFPPDPVTGDHPIVAVLMPPNATTGVTQHLALEARAGVGSGGTHARFCPVSVCAFAPVVDEAAAEAASREAAALADPDRFEFLERPRLAKRDPVTGKPDAYRFFLETACGLSPRDVVTAGFEALAARLRDAAEQLADPEATHVDASGMAPDVHAVRLRDHSSTLGAVLQAELLDGEGEGGGAAEFLGYHTPHPLEPFLLVRGRPRDPAVDAEGFRRMLRTAAERGALRAERMADDWRRASEALAAPPKGAPPTYKAAAAAAAAK